MKLNFYITGCELVGMGFNPDRPKESPRRDEYKMFNNEYPYLYLYNTTLASSPSMMFNKNISDTFLSEDPTNCPCISY